MDVSYNLEYIALLYYAFFGNFQCFKFLILKLCCNSVDDISYCFVLCSVERNLDLEKLYSSVKVAVRIFIIMEIVCRRDAGRLVLLISINNLDFSLAYEGDYSIVKSVACCLLCFRTLCVMEAVMY